MMAYRLHLNNHWISVHFLLKIKNVHRQSK
jgi:hypothetical protein